MRVTLYSALTNSSHDMPRCTMDEFTRSGFGFVRSLHTDVAVLIDIPAALGKPHSPDLVLCTASSHCLTSGVSDKCSLVAISYLVTVAV